MRFAARALPPLALAATMFAWVPAQAATIATSTSPGPLSVTVGTSTPQIVGQSYQVGLEVTNTSADPIGPFTMGIQVSPNAKVTGTTTAGVHTCTRAGNGFACDFLSQLQPGLTMNAWSLTIVPQSAGQITITGFVQPTLGSSAPTNSAQLVVDAVVVSKADLQLTQSASTNSPVAGAPISYTAQVKNAGPDTASAVSLTDQISLDGVALGAMASNGAPCGISGQLVSCSLGDIASGSSVTVKVSALAPLTITGSSDVVATVSSSTFDPNMANNVAATTITVK